MTKGNTTSLDDFYPFDRLIDKSFDRFWNRGGRHTNKSARKVLKLRIMLYLCRTFKKEER